MLPVLLNPWALLGLISIPVLVGIYVLRNRHRRLEVSSLLLWLDPRETRSGGPRIERLQLPLLFFLELLILILLVLAACDPYVRNARQARPVFIVLDDSFSMLAGRNDSPRSRGQRAIEELFDERNGIDAHLILAGTDVQVTGEVVKSKEALQKQLQQWKCHVSTANLDAAMALATELGGELSLILVITDQAPPTEPEKGRIQWWAFGGSRPNVAIVTAVRTPQDGKERCLLEIANLSDAPRSFPLAITTTPDTGVGQSRRETLQPNEARRILLDLPKGTPSLKAEIQSGDVLAIDNQVSLEPVSSRPVRIQIGMAEGQLRSMVEKAIRSATGVILSDEQPEILFTDSSRENAPSGTWLVEMIAEKEAEAYIGPFILDRSHPLTMGLDLEGRIWSAGKTTEVGGKPVIQAGRVPLLTDESGGLGMHTIRLRLRPSLSTLQGSPNWPILISNLIQWRASERPGLDRPNIRVGEQAVVSFLQAPDSVEIRDPGGSARSLTPGSNRVVVRGEEPGTYELRYDKETVRISVNALNARESDLRDRVSGRWGDWLDKTSLRLEYRSIAWVFLLLALAVLTLHLYLVHRLKRS